jgi:hypothetical protein
LCLQWNNIWNQYFYEYVYFSHFFTSLKVDIQLKKNIWAYLDCVKEIATCIFYKTNFENCSMMYAETVSFFNDSNNFIYKLKTILMQAPFSFENI